MKCISLQTAKLLREAGWPQEGDYYWVEKFPMFLEADSLVAVDVLNERLLHSVLSKEAKDLIKTFAAPDVSNLLEAMPLMEFRLYVLEVPESQGGGKDYLAYPVGEHEQITGRSRNPSDALALLWLSLRKQGII
jgi:hypothetical protein